MTPFNPDDWKDVVALVMIFTATPVLTAGLPLWFQARKVIKSNTKKLDTASKKLDKIDGQVSNTHDENLRDEITRGFREVREDIRLLATALNIERQERIDGDNRCKEVA